MAPHKILLLLLCILALSLASVLAENTAQESTLEQPGLTPLSVEAQPEPTLLELSQEQKDRVKSILHNPLIRKAQLSIEVEHIDSGQILFQRDQNSFCLPASTNKLVTGAAALSILKPDFRFTTKVYVDHRPDADGTVNGNLYIVGAGDPSLSLEQVWLLAHGIRIAGVRRITGDLVGDDSFHDQVRFYPEWGEQSHRAYHASLGALSVNWNTIAFWVRPGARIGDSARITLAPHPPGLKIIGKIKTVEGYENKCYMGLKNNRALVSGTIGIHARPKPTYHAIHNPLRYALSAIRDQMQKEGIEIRGKNKPGKQPERAKLIHEHQSDELSKIIRQLFLFSNNFTAEQILRTLGAVQDSVPGTRAKGALAIENWLKEKGLWQEGQVIFDGSGLSRENRQSAASLVKILSWMARQPRMFPEYIQAQPLAGISGTLRYRFKKTELVGRLRAKTGLLNGVISLAGYSYDARGKLYSFAVLINNFDPSQGVRGPQILTEKLLDVLMQ